MHLIISHSIKFFSIFILIIFHTTLCADELIKNITIKGNSRIEDSTINNYLGLNIGDKYTTLKQSDAIKNLYVTSLFKDISIDFVRNNLIVTVVEKPLVYNIQIQGNSKVKNSQIYPILLTNIGESLSESKIQIDAQKIKALYDTIGRFSTTVTATTQSQIENNRASVIFKISEGTKSVIKNVYFVGNKNYNHSELKSVILTKESRWFRFLETNDTYNPERIDYDKELLKSFYKSLGFADFRVVSVIAELSKNKEYFTLTYVIDEGEKYQLSNVNVKTKLPNIDLSKINQLVTAKPKQIFNMSALEQIADNIAKVLADLGYPQINVYPHVINDPNNKTIDVTFVIDKADKIFVNQINIEGNLKTHDDVIRREISIAEGDLFRRSKLERADRNIRNLDYFETVGIGIVPTDQQGKYNININVEEKSTASIGLDMGYNSVGGPFGRISFTERNLLGTGKYLTFGVQGGNKNISYYLGITDPHFLNKDLAFSTNIFDNYNGRGSGFLQADQPYNLKSIGMRNAISYDVAEDLSHSVEYSIKQDHLTASNESTSRFIIDQQGKFVTSAVSHTLTYDVTDSRIVPKNGYILSGTQEYAGIGGNTKYLKHEVEGKYFQSIIDNKLTFIFAASVGDIRGVGSAKTVRIADRFNLGDYTLRGFSSGGIGPRDKKTNEGLGGEHFYSFTTEVNFPLGLPSEFNVRGLLFADLGNVFGVHTKSKDYTKENFYNDKADMFRSSIGLGFIWVTRIAPIRMDWGFPIKKKSYDETQRFHIKLSTHF